MTLFADDIRPRVCCNSTTGTTLFSNVLTALWPCDRVLTQCNKLKIRVMKGSGVDYNTAVFYTKDLLGK